MKKLVAGLAVLAVLAGAPAFAANPHNDCCDVDVTVKIDAITELWSSLGTAQERQSAAPPVLNVTNASGVIPASGKAQDTMAVCANVDTDISVAILGGTNIPTGTRFHVIVAPTNRATYNCVGAWTNGQVISGVTIENVVAAKVITWDRRASGYVGTAPGTSVPAYSGTTAINAVSTAVDYAADAIHEMPAIQEVTPTVMWTIAAM